MQGLKVLLKQAEDKIIDCRLVDQRIFRRRIERIKKESRQGKLDNHRISELHDQILTSASHCNARRENLPIPDYPVELPVSERREEIAKTISQHQVVILAGETGSGKTTQLPKICLELGRGVKGLIGHTQPRRIAARSVAERIASELHTELGALVGYKVRFHDQVNQHSYIKLMTDGILLAEIQNDKDLLQYDTIIIDEAHERSLNIDFLLGYLKNLLPRRKDLKLIITSATIDTEKFSKHFSDAPIVKVSGRTYPVEIRYKQPGTIEDKDEQDVLQDILDAVDEVSRMGRGDILVFMSGERDIRETAEALRKHHPPETEILPLFAKLSVSEQSRVFTSHKRRRIVLATNVAETSLTVPGIQFVIDPGYARISRYSFRSKVQRLPIERISQASANQRSGRCGRVSAGICVRLYSEENFNARAEFTMPEIQRTNLASVILKMKTLHFGNVEKFPFVDPPDRRFINDGYRLLQELGAVDQERNLTSLGREISKFPTDPGIARMVLAASEENCLHEVLIIASALTVQDPRERPMDKQQKADEVHSKFRDKTSDFLGWLNLWNAYHEQSSHLSKTKLGKWCKQNFLTARRMQEWRDIHSQLYKQVRSTGHKPNQTPAKYHEIHQALLYGLLSNIGVKEKASIYTGSHNKEFMIFPGSGLFHKKPKWIMASEIVETSRLYARTVAGIKPEWIEHCAKYLVKYSYSEPHWEKNNAQVAAFENASLYGLVLASGRKVNYGPLFPKESREIFIRSALVNGDYQTRAEFFEYNKSLLSDIQMLEDKSRRRDILIDEEDLYSFYDERIPEGIYSGKSFEKWRITIEKESSRHLFMEIESLMQHKAEHITEDQFPDKLIINRHHLELKYHFDPAANDDGVTLIVPLPLLNQIEQKKLEWIVPGLLEEKITALIRTLPKNIRRNFVPVPEYASACMNTLSSSDESLLESVSSQLKRMSGIDIPHDAWSPEKLPDHLRFNFFVVDNQGEQLATGRDLSAIQGQLEGTVKEEFIEVHDSEFERENITEWDFGDLPEKIEIINDNYPFITYPALSEEKEKDDYTVALRIYETSSEAERNMHKGLRRLIMLQQKKEVSYLKKNIPCIQNMCLQYTPIDTCSTLIDDIIIASIDTVLHDEYKNFPEGIKNKLQYDHCRTAVSSSLITTGNDLGALASKILSEFTVITRRLKGSIPATWIYAIANIKEQLDGMIFKNFIREIPYKQLLHYPRYLKAIQKRLEKLENNPTRDRQLSQEINLYLQLFSPSKSKAADMGAELEKYRWMLEEYRVSLFSQELKTAYPVSKKRLDDQWKKVNTKR